MEFSQKKFLYSIMRNRKFLSIFFLVPCSWHAHYLTPTSFIKASIQYNNNTFYPRLPNSLYHLLQEINKTQINLLPHLFFFKIFHDNWWRWTTWKELTDCQLVVQVNTKYYHRIQWLFYSLDEISLVFSVLKAYYLT